MEALNTILMLYGTKVGFVVEIMAVIAMIIVILVQRTSNDGLSGLGSGGLSGHSILSSAQSKNLLTRTTAILATIFLVNSLILAKLSTLGTHAPSLVDQYDQQAPAHARSLPHGANVPLSAPHGSGIPATSGGSTTAPSDVPVNPAEAPKNNEKPNQQPDQTSVPISE
ncbi:MAG: preprotein translocase subunit SecG [Alphaproteobacteria bacterium]|nr:preprotein translocase subunit SecG [Alphaproteobacteria bacterium]